MFWGSVAMIAGYAAYTAEVFRSGMDAVHDSQRSAAKALGLSQGQTLRYAVLPQAVRNVLPALLNGSVSLQKDVALLSVIGVRDAVREAQIYTARTYNYSSLIGAAVLFLAASIPLALSVGVERGQIAKGDLLVMEAIGGGLAWGAVVLRW